LFFNTLEASEKYPGEAVFQYWMEDPVLLREKFRWARDHGLAGVGPFVFHNLDPVNEAEESQAMWSAFDDFIFDGIPKVIGGRRDRDDAIHSSSLSLTFLQPSSWYGILLKYAHTLRLKVHRLWYKAILQLYPFCSRYVP
jgi:hypothetical protein